jgi:hypothetical protein
VRGRNLLQSARYCLQHTIHIAHDVVIPETQHAIIVLTKPPVSYNVALTFSMLPTIDFENQSLLSADEINNITSNRLLPHELVSADRVCSQPIPETQFSIRRIAAKPSC